MSMATRNAANLPRRLEKSTDFQLCIESGVEKNIIDFTERKLFKYAMKTVDIQQRLTLLAMVDDYRKGHIAIAWKRGQPTYIRVTRETGNIV